MEKRTTDEIRNLFLGYFREKNHLLIPGDSILPKNDPTLLYINSGMAPLKPYFLGEAQPPAPRLANVQACIRTIDIEEVGDRHHLTFFEMLGSWSIGDYYKATAIELAYELLVSRFGFDPRLLYATVFAGDPTLNLPPDEDSAKFWEQVGLPGDHIVPLGLDNFWGPAGESGPCGPCTEVFIDTGATYGATYVPGGEFDTKNRYIEIWNAGVFMEYNKHLDGTFTPLPMKSVDTGSGLERMQMAINKYITVYETDLLRPILEAVATTFGSQISERERFILSDHMKTTTFILSTGVEPSNIGRAYIPRRLIRKCVAIATAAGQSGRLLTNVADAVIARMQAYYPHLATQHEQTRAMLLREVAEFEPIIETGLHKLEQRLARFDGQILPGEVVFEMVTTYGLPLEVVGDYLTTKGITFDEEQYWKAFRRHQEISRTGLVTGHILPGVGEDLPVTTFTGYESVEAEGSILRLVKGGSAVDEAGAGESVILIADCTPFYAEAGGQVGDTGDAKTPTGWMEIIDTKKERGIYLHYGTVVTGIVKVDQLINMQVNKSRRREIMRNHSATHLLHSALRSILGPHVIQQGSLVAPERLRFDFRHDGALSAEQLRTIEAQVNEWIRDNIQSDIRQMPYDQAVGTGAMALFSENYGDVVRVVGFNDVSKELCGGTHVGSTGEIGLFLINSERSISKGVRRIEALTGTVALREVQWSIATLQELASTLKTPVTNIAPTVQHLLTSRQKELASAYTSAQSLLQQVEHQSVFETAEGEKVLIGQLNAPANTLKDVAQHLIDQKHAHVVALGGVAEDKLSVVVMVNPSLQGKVPANEVLKEILAVIDGKGGGKPVFAMGGSKEVNRIADFLRSSRVFISGRLSAQAH